MNPLRGDVIIFNNTSAEHPATYDFVRRCKKIAEEQYGIPFFWTEFQTYEDSIRGRWGRLPAYRMVNAEPWSESNSDGYHWRGEVFEELLSWKGFVPNLFSRICTETMKIFVTREFLRDWFAVKPETEHLGHYGENGSRLNDDDLCDMHRRNGGGTPREVFLEKKGWLKMRPVARKPQKFADFSIAAKNRAPNPALSELSLGGRVPVNGDNCVEYIAFVGFRNDEPVRVVRMEARNRGSSEEDGIHEKNRPEGEYAYAPLAKIGVSKAAVNRFWKKQHHSRRLLLPDDANLSNCVFCFLKGGANLLGILARRKEVDETLPPELRSVAGTPSDIDWWIEIEQKYARDLLREKREIRVSEERPIIGFFGIDRGNYALLKQKGEETQLNRSRRRHSKQDTALEIIDGMLPCDCTD